LPATLPTTLRSWFQLAASARNDKIKESVCIRII